MSEGGGFSVSLYSWTYLVLDKTNARMNGAKEKGERLHQCQPEPWKPAKTVLDYFRVSMLLFLSIILYRISRLPLEFGLLVSVKLDCAICKEVSSFKL